MAWYDDIAAAIAPSADKVKAASGTGNSTFSGIVDTFKLVTDTAINYELAKNPAQEGIDSIVGITTTESTLEENPNQRVATPAQFVGAYTQQQNVNGSILNNDNVKIGLAILAGLLVAKLVV